MSAKKLFFAYAQQDIDFARELEKHLVSLRREGILESWHEGLITHGEVADEEIERHLEEAEVILFLLSVDFLASSHLYDALMMRALKKKLEASVCVFAVVLRAADYSGFLIDQLLCLPTNLKPINEWKDRDAAWLDVVSDLRLVLACDIRIFPRPEGITPELGRRPESAEFNKNTIAEIIKIELNYARNTKIEALIKNRIDQPIFLHGCVILVGQVYSRLVFSKASSGFVFRGDYKLEFPHGMGYWIYNFPVPIRIAPQDAVQLELNLILRGGHNDYFFNLGFLIDDTTILGDRIFWIRD